MDAERPAPAQLAKGALRRLAMARQEPTPTNFSRAYADEAGEPAPAPQGAAWAQLIERLAKGLERGGRHWTGARKKDSLQRVLDGSRSDAQRLQHRLSQLVGAWDGDTPDADIDAVQSPGVAANDRAANDSAANDRATNASAANDSIAAGPGAPGALAADAQPRLVQVLQATLCAGLPADDPRAAELADELAVLAARVAHDGATPALADAVADVCHRVQRLFGQRHELVDELLALCRSLTAGIADFADDPRWADGTVQGLRQRLDSAAGARAVRAARELLDGSRAAQQNLQAERAQARDALKQMVRQVLAELGALDSATDRFGDKVAGYAQAVEAADSLDSLAAAVRGMLDESRAVQGLVAGARSRLAAEHARAAALESRVLGLEAELRRLSDEVSTDALTQVANRRGLAQAFALETAWAQRTGADDAVGAGAGAAPLAVGLIDIDNFKKLNDSLGHAAGDVALQNLAARVKDWLRPVDHIARFGGEEFVLLLPATPVDEAQQAITRLQRRLSASLFMHDGQEVFVTFSAGVTAWRPGEAIDSALARADEGLYEAKRTGKNRTCSA